MPQRRLAVYRAMDYELTAVGHRQVNGIAVQQVLAQRLLLHVWQRTRLPAQCHTELAAYTRNTCKHTSCKSPAAKETSQPTADQQRWMLQPGHKMQAASKQACPAQGNQLTRSRSQRPRSVTPMARAGSPEMRTSICLRCATCHKAQGGCGWNAGCPFAMANVIRMHAAAAAPQAARRRSCAAHAAVFAATPAPLPRCSAH